MNITTVPSIIYTPTVLDWLGSKLSKEFSCTYDESGNIGKKYRRQDIIGTLFCITFEDESLLPKKSCRPLRHWNQIDKKLRI